MEFAGVFLGAIPVALLAIQAHREVLQVRKNHKEYNRIIGNIRVNVIVQQKSLASTLQMIGLHPDTASERQLQQRLQICCPQYANDCFILMSHMRQKMEDLLDRLDVDSQGRVLCCMAYISQRDNTGS